MNRRGRNKTIVPGQQCPRPRFFLVKSRKGAETLLSGGPAARRAERGWGSVRELDVSNGIMRFGARGVLCARLIAGFIYFAFRFCTSI